MHQLRLSQGPAPKAVLWFLLTGPPLSLHALPSLINKRLKGFHAQEPNRVLLSFSISRDRTRNRSRSVAWTHRQENPRESGTLWPGRDVPDQGILLNLWEKRWTWGDLCIQAPSVRRSGPPSTSPSPDFSESSQGTCGL